QQMSSALQNFKAKYRVDYIPSQIVLHENMANYGNTQIERDSLDYLKRVWPHLQTTVVPGNPAATRINWAGRPLAPNPPFNTPVFSLQDSNRVYTLQGDQCLVFFLGGIPRDTLVGGKQLQVPSGFSSNPSDPTSTSGV